MEDKDLEAKQVAVTKLELAFRKALKKKKKEILWNPRARREIDLLRKNILLKEDTIAMFAHVGLINDYTILLKDVNKILDGDLNIKI